jgi:hypothetical protein
MIRVIADCEYCGVVDEFDSIEELNDANYHNTDKIYICCIGCLNSDLTLEEETEEVTRIHSLTN